MAHRIYREVDDAAHADSKDPREGIQTFDEFAMEWATRFLARWEHIAGCYAASVPLLASGVTARDVWLLHTEPAFR